jgi:hypothetical protein
VVVLIFSPSEPRDKECRIRHSDKAKRQIPPQRLIVLARDFEEPAAEERQKPDCRPQTLSQIER